MKILKNNTDLMWRYIIKILFYMTPSTKPSLLERVWVRFKKPSPLERAWEKCKKFLSKEKANMVLRYPLRTVLQIKQHLFLGNEKSRLGTIEYVKHVFSSTCIFVKMPKIYFLMCVFTLAMPFLHGQGYYTEQDTTEMKNALKLDNNDTKMSPQEQSATSDSLKKVAYWIQRLKDVVNVKKDVLYGQEVTAIVRQLQDSNFVLAQPIVSVHGKGIFIGLMNQVGSLFEGNNTEPWLKLNSEIVPQQAKSIPFTLDAKLTGSAKIQTTWLTIAETKMDSVYKNKKYLKIDDALADLETANAVALAYLQKAIGKTLAPPFLLKVNNTKYWGGVKIPLWQKTGTDSTHLIDFVTRNGQNPNGDITWACSTLVNTNYDQAWVNVKKTGTSTLTVTYQDSLTQTFTLNVTSSDAKAIVEDFLKTLAKEVIAEIISSGIDDITKNYASLDSVVSSMGTLNEEITTDLNEIDFDVSQGQNEDLEIIYLDNEQFLNTTTKLTDAKINNVSLYMLKYELSQMLIKRKALITLLVNKALFEPDEFEDLITDLKNNFIVTIGGFTAEMIVNGLQPAAKAKIKDSLKVYLNKIFDDAAKKLE